MDCIYSSDNHFLLNPIESLNRLVRLFVRVPSGACYNITRRHQDSVRGLDKPVYPVQTAFPFRPRSTSSDWCRRPIFRTFSCGLGSRVGRGDYGNGDRLKGNRIYPVTVDPYVRSMFPGLPVQHDIVLLAILIDLLGFRIACPCDLFVGRKGSKGAILERINPLDASLVQTRRLAPWNKTLSLRAA